MTQLSYRCYAKVNLTLEVIRRREDGYHDLASLVHTISLADDLHVGIASTLVSRVDGLDLAAECNLVTRAALLLAAAANVSPRAELRLRKRIPAAAGLGGGSSDAATALVGLNTLWGIHLATADLTRIAASLGSDVPFFVNGGAALMTGRGDQLEALPPLKRQWLILATPAHAVRAKTALLYSALEPRDFSSGAATERAAVRLRQRQAISEEDLVNVFARAARCVFPDLADAWAAAEAVCGRRFFLSGAGPGLFALARDRADARRQATRLARSGVSAFSARTVGQGRQVVKLQPVRSSGTLKRDPRARCLVVQW